MWRTTLLIVIIVGLILVAVLWPGKESKPKLTSPNEPHVLLIVADSLMPQPLFTLMQAGELPGFAYLQQHGFMTELTSVFPTMSVVNDSTLLSGTYPDEHGIPGLVWFNRDENRFVDYGDSLGNIARQGPLKVAKDTVFNLNDQHLSPDVETVHEYLAKQGVSSASVNMLVRRGASRHELRFPFNLILGKKEISGPALLRHGYFVKDGSRPFPNPFNRYGYSNDEAEKITLRLMRKPEAPRLIITYLSDPDKIVHKKGPDAKQQLYDVDRFIQHILDAFPNREEALKNWRIMVMGDSGQASVNHDKKRALIVMPELLSPYTLRGLSKAPENADLAVATNERSAYLYPLHNQLDVAELAEHVITDERVDFAAYVKNDRVHVETAKGNLHFQRGGEKADPYGQKWDVTGDPGLLDVKESKDHWEYGTYKDVFRQLHGAVYSQPSAVVVAAKPGYEFQFESSPTHVGGGSHGGISLREMTIPLVVGGTKLKPQHDRLVDLKQYLIDCVTYSHHLR